MTIPINNKQHRLLIQLTIEYYIKAQLQQVYVNIFTLSIEKGISVGTLTKNDI